MPDRPVQVAAVVDRNLCSLAAVRTAAAHAARAELPVVVVYRRPPIPGLTLMTVPLAPLDHQELEADTFVRAARILSPYGLSWDFRPVDPGVDLRCSWQLGERGSSVVVTAPHLGSWPPFAARLREKRAARLRRVAALLVAVGCDHGTEERSRDLILEA